MGLIVKIAGIAITGTALFEIFKPITKEIIQYVHENKNTMDMPPWEHEKKWNTLSNKKETCYFHKVSQKKVCRQN